MRNAPVDTFRTIKSSRRRLGKVPGVINDLCHSAVLSFTNFRGLFEEILILIVKTLQGQFIPQISIAFAIHLLTAQQPHNVVSTSFNGR